MKHIYFLFLVMFALFAPHSVNSQSHVYFTDGNGILYVDSSARGNGSGRNWQNAIPNLADAMRAADSINRPSNTSMYNHLNPFRPVRQIWVAKGTYYPKYSAEDSYRKVNRGRYNTFVLPRGWNISNFLYRSSGMVSVYGGFSGVEVSVNARDKSKINTENKTILSGAIEGGENNYHVVIAAGSFGVLDGFVITEGKANNDIGIIKVNGLDVPMNQGAGLYARNPITLMNCEFISNTSIKEGAGIYSSADIQAENCLFRNNISNAQGGAVYNLTATSAYTNCEFKGNEARIGAGIYHKGGEAQLTNCRLYGNKGGAIYNENAHCIYINSLFTGNKGGTTGGTIVNYSSSPHIINCTIAGNEAQYGAAIFNFGNASPVITNTIIWGNSSGIQHTTGNISINNSIVQDADMLTKGMNNVQEDPKFINAVDFSKAPDISGDYRLHLNSVARDKGTKNIGNGINFPTTDLLGTPRILGFLPDIGAFELQRVIPNAEGTIYVDQNVSGGEENGSSWKNAIRELSEALYFTEQWNKIKPGSIKQIWVAKGLYEPDTAFVLLKNVKLYGGFSATETSLSDRKTDTANLFNKNATVLGVNFSKHIVIAAGDLGEAEINGFVISKGYAEGNGSMQVNGYKILDDEGGGLYHTDGHLSIKLCKFSQNHGFNGGAFYSENGSFNIENCVFENNKAKNWGGAIWIKHVNSASSIINSSFTRNHTLGNPNKNLREGGGAIHLREVNAEMLNISSCTFESNYTPINGGTLSGGAIFNHEASPAIDSCSFTNNTSTYGGAIFNENSTPVITNSTFTGNEVMFEFLAGNGGAIYNSGSSPIITNSSFIANKANGMGGAILNFNSSSPTIAGCVFVENLVGEKNPSAKETEGNAILNTVNSSPAIINSTIVGSPKNSYSHVYNKNSSSPVIVNTIIWGSDNSLKSLDGAANVTYSMIQRANGETWPGDGNMNKNPGFLNLNPSDYTKGNYQLSENSPALGTGDVEISKYHLPATDITGNPLIVDRRINIGAYARTFTHPTNLIATYHNRDSVTVSWKAALQTGSSYVGGDNFKLERSTDSTFKANVKLITASYAYDPNVEDYFIEDDVTDMRGGTKLFYRLRRTAGENQPWGRTITTSANITVVKELKGLSAQITSKEGETPVVKVSWEKFPGVWLSGTKFTLKKKNKTTGTEEAIDIKKEEARQGYYIDDNIPVCKEITYSIAVSLGNNYGSPAPDNIPDTILTSELSPLTNLQVSKGYFRDRTALAWESGGSYDHYIIKRAVYGLENYEQIAAVPGAGLQSLQADDKNGTPGVYYQYQVSGMVKCGSKNLYSSPVVAIGFASPTGTVYGRVTYEKGGGAVQNATVRMESVDKANLGRSLQLNGNATIKLDSLTTASSDSAFTVEAWIRPNDQQPKNQIIFTTEGQYELGFNEEGLLYFQYYDQAVTAKYQKDTVTGFVHIAGVFTGDSLLFFLNGKASSGKAVSRQSREFPLRAYIGGNSDGGRYRGYLDELRLWNIAVPASQIELNHSRLLTGGEAGLIAYWQFNASIKDQFFDISRNGEHYHQNDGFIDPQHIWYSDIIPSTNQLSLKAYTDSTGNYTISGIPYTGINGTIYSIGPKLGSHSFDPVTVTRIFSAGSSTFTLNFTDKSSYTVSGYVTYQNTTVPVKGVQFKIDGNFAFTGNGGIAQTNDDGFFEISVPVGEHEVQAVKPNHVFANNGKITDINGNNHNYQSSLANVKIYDSTKIRFIGRVAGGSVEADYPLGFSLSKNILSSAMSITLKLSSDGNYALNSGPAEERNYQHTYYSNEKEGAIESSQSTTVKYDKNEIVIYPDTLTGEFVAELIPASFKISSVAVKGYPSPLSGTVLVDLTDSLLEKSILYERRDSTFLVQSGEWGNFTSYGDTVKYNASYVFTVYREPVIEVKQSINAGNPNTVNHFGNETYSYSTLNGDKLAVPLYDKQTGNYTFHHPVFQQSQQYGFKITSFEAYPYFRADGSIRDTTFVPSKGGLITVNNGMKEGSSAPDTFSIQSDGTAYYSFVAGEPELSDQIGLKGFAVTVKIGSEVYEWNKGNMYRGYIFGGRSVGEDFVTTGPHEFLGVLRDPPGSNSYSYIKKGSTLNHTRSFSTTYNETGSVHANISEAPVIKIIKGVGVAEATEINTILETNISITEEINWLRDSTYVNSITFEEGFQTSNDPSFVGEINDVFIGSATDITFGTVLTLIPIATKDIRQGTDVVFFQGPENGYSIVQRTGLQSGQTFNTLFAYPQYFIIDNLIPNLIKIRNTILAEGSALTNPQATANSKKKLFYVSKISPSDTEKYGASNIDGEVFGEKANKDKFWDGPSYTIYYPQEADGSPATLIIDTILILNQHIAQWNNWLAQNEKIKVEAAYDKNLSFGSGASVDRSISAYSDYSFTESWDWVASGSVELVSGFKLNNVGIIATATLSGGGGGDTSSTNTHGKTLDVGYHLELDGSNYISVDVGMDPDSLPVFRIKGGVTSCPYEGGTFTKYYNPGTVINQPTVQREMPQITVDKPVVSGIAGNRQASYTIHLQNASSVKGDIYFGLNVIDKTNPYGAKVYLDGTSLGAGRDILIPAGEKITKTITLEKGPDSMRYENIQLVLHSTCQYNPQVYSVNIGDTISISAHFLPSCSDIQLASPTSQWLLNSTTALNEDGYPVLPVTIEKYDLNTTLFNHIALQYKAATSPEWVTVKRFFTDSTTYNGDQQGGAKEVIQSADKINYDLVMNPNFSDGRYDIRAVSVCVENGQIIAQTPSDIMSGVKDTYTPRLFGNPQPANGVLSYGDDVKLTFNETIDAGFLNNNNFTVKAVKNGSALDSLVAVQLDGENDYVQTEFPKNLAGKDFTVEMWIMPDTKGAGTLFSHSNAKEAVELAFAEDYSLEVTLGSKTHKSNHALPWLPGQWVHIALVYSATDSSARVFYNFNSEMLVTKAGEYNGAGPFLFGKSIQTDRLFRGKIRNVRVWTQALSSLQLQVNSSILLSGSETNLLACYPMNEGKGKTLRDKAHGNHASFNGQWKLPPGKAVAFEGDGYVMLNTSQAVITRAMDYTLSLWFNAHQAQTNATLLSSGKGDGTDLGGSQNLFWLGFENGLLTFKNNGISVYADGHYADNNWHNATLAVNRNTGVAQLYVDGQLQKYFDAGDLGALASTHTYVGARAFRTAEDSTTTQFDQYFKGQIDEVRIWNTYLNSSIIAGNDNVKLKGNETGLLAWYPFEEHVNFNGIWSTEFSRKDQKIQKDPNNKIEEAQLTNAVQTNESSPMKDPGPQQNLRYDFVVNNDAIVINLTGGMDERKAIDKTIVTFTAQDVRDMNGNLLVSPITWTAYINRNPLTWSDESLNLTKELNMPLQFEVYILNTGGKEEQFIIGNLPTWLTVSNTTGIVPPQGKIRITFTINRGLNTGTYDHMIEMINSLQESRSLALNVKVRGKVPDWSVDAAQFKYSMNLYGKIRINGTFSQNEEDLLAAFINGECVGVANNTYIASGDLWYALLTVYNNDLKNKNVEFRIWDAATGKVYAGIPSKALTFANDNIVGTPREPVIFDGEELMYQNIDLARGWNWVSFNLANPKLDSARKALVNGNWQSGDIVKHDERGFNQYSTSAGWVGTLESFDNISLFKLFTANTQTLSMSGTPVDLKQTPILVRGNRWSYISYLPQVNMTVKDALAGYEATTGDVVKSQTGFAMYDERMGWVGNLTYMEPGHGYMFFRNIGADESFVYPAFSGNLQIPRFGRPGNEAGDLHRFQKPVDGNYRYSNNMTVVAIAGPGISLLKDDKILALAGNEIRGEATAMLNRVLDDTSFFFNIAGDQQVPLYFAIERNGRIIAKTKPVLSYIANGQAGTLKNPLVLDFGAVNEKDDFEVIIYPNPFKDKVEIHIRLRDAGSSSAKIKLLIYDVGGQLVFAKDEKRVAGDYETTWNGRTNTGATCTPGVYFIHVVKDGKPHIFKLIKH